MARVLLESPKIMKALREALAHRFDVAASAAQATLLEICADKRAPARARISAAQEILNRAPSVGPVASRSVNVTAKATVEDVLDFLDAKEKELASNKASVIEGSAIDVTPAADRESDAADE